MTTTTAEPLGHSAGGIWYVLYSGNLVAPQPSHFIHGSDFFCTPSRFFWASTYPWKLFWPSELNRKEARLHCLCTHSGAKTFVRLYFWRAIFVTRYLCYFTVNQKLAYCGTAVKNYHCIAALNLNTRTWSSPYPYDSSRNWFGQCYNSPLRAGIKSLQTNQSLSRN